jgi:hypothetical protein
MEIGKTKLFSYKGEVNLCFLRWIHQPEVKLMTFHMVEYNRIIK